LEQILERRIPAGKKNVKKTPVLSHFAKKSTIIYIKRFSIFKLLTELCPFV